MRSTFIPNPSTILRPVFARKVVRWGEVGGDDEGPE
jgi:hypothetical protein